MSAGAHHRCRCGHAAATHEHYRRGADCGACDCRRYRAQRSPRATPPAAGTGGVDELRDLVQTSGTR